MQWEQILAWILCHPRAKVFLLLSSSTTLFCVLPQLMKLQFILTPISLSLIGHFQSIDRIVNSSPTNLAYICCVLLLWQEACFALVIQHEAWVSVWEHLRVQIGRTSSIHGTQIWSDCGQGCTQCTRGASWEDGEPWKASSKWGLISTKDKPLPLSTMSSLRTETVYYFTKVFWVPRRVPNTQQMIPRI